MQNISLKHSSIAKLRCNYLYLTHRTIRQQADFFHVNVGKHVSCLEAMGASAAAIGSIAQLLTERLPL